MDADLESLTALNATYIRSVVRAEDPRSSELARL